MNGLHSKRHAIRRLAPTSDPSWELSTDSNGKERTTSRGDLDVIRSETAIGRGRFHLKRRALLFNVYSMRTRSTAGAVNGYIHGLDTCTAKKFRNVL